MKLTNLTGGSRGVLHNDSREHDADFRFFVFFRFFRLTFRVSIRKVK